VRQKTKEPNNDQSTTPPRERHRDRSHHLRSSAYSWRSLDHAMKRLTLAAALALTAASATAMTVHNDAGGSVYERAAQIAALSERVKISGYCNSSCTMYLALPDVCADRNAVFGFHGPSSQFYGMALLPEQFEAASGVMAAHYPDGLRGWFMAEGRHRLIGTYDVSAAYLIDRGYIWECE
jgi:hypothetical protein